MVAGGGDQGQVGNEEKPGAGAVEQATDAVLGINWIDVELFVQIAGLRACTRGMDFVVACVAKV